MGSSHGGRWDKAQQYYRDGLRPALRRPVPLWMLAIRLECNHANVCDRATGAREQQILLCDSHDVRTWGTILSSVAVVAEILLRSPVLPF